MQKKLKIKKRICYTLISVFFLNANAEVIYLDTLAVSLKEEQPQIQVKESLSKIELPKKEFFQERGLFYNPKIIAPPSLDEVFFVNGSIKVTEGLFYHDQMTLNVFFKSFEDPRLQADVNKRTGEYKVPVNNSIGYITAEMIGENGLIIGKGVQDFVYSPKEKLLKRRPILIKPVVEGAGVLVESSYSYDENIKIEEDAYVQTYFSGDRLIRNAFSIFEGPDLLNFSSYIALAAKPGHWDTLIFGRSQEVERTRLFRETTMKALYGLTSKDELFEDTGVIFGRITHKGKPLPGVIFEISGIDLEPVYFKELFKGGYLPETKMKATDSSGYFSFVGIPRGLYAVRPVYGDSFFPAQVIKVENQAVSFMNFQLGTEKLVQVLSHTFPREKTVKTSFSVMGTRSDFLLDSGAKFRFPFSGNFNFFETLPPEEYFYVRAMVMKGAQQVELPLIEKDWLQSQIKTPLLHQDTGIIFGFVDEAPYRIKIISETNVDFSDQVVFFDFKGNGLPGPTGEGGFAFYNLPEGVYSIFLKTAQGTSTKVAIVERGYLFFIPPNRD